MIRPRSIRALAVILAVLVYFPGFGATRPINITARPVPLHTEDTTHTRVGSLVYLGGLRLESDARDFGGFSGLHISADGDRLTAISDFGRRLEARLFYSGESLVGIADASLTLLSGPDGKTITGKGEGDAEGIARLGGSLLVSFERQHRILSYGPSANFPHIVPPPPGLERAPENGGIEALAALPGGRLLVILEAAIAGASETRSNLSLAWIREGGRWTQLFYARTGQFSPSASAVVPAGKGVGDVLVVERHWSMMAGTTVRIWRIAARQIAGASVGTHLSPKQIARLAAPMTVDNFEGISVRRGRGGAVLVYIISDDNFSPLQQTLLMLFRLDG
ncbi:MAG: esterase-like activity of phytase family protein [Pseudomonadota bacterium]|nr:esterase-like activity of phytase family protein [Pseudomonadota bacterium]